MAHRVRKAVLDQAHKCPSGHCCLESGDQLMCRPNRPSCQVEDKIEGDGLFVIPAHHGACPYRVTFGHGYICNCPVRAEIFRLHGL